MMGSSVEFHLTKNPRNGNPLLPSCGILYGFHLHLFHMMETTFDGIHWWITTVLEIHPRETQWNPCSKNPPTGNPQHGSLVLMVESNNVHLAGFCVDSDAQIPHDPLGGNPSSPAVDSHHQHLPTWQAQVLSGKNRAFTPQRGLRMAALVLSH